MTATGADAAGRGPLVKVVGVTVSEKSGAELGAHRFWMSHDYTLELACGHETVRSRNTYYGTDPNALNNPLPKSVRCADCPPRTVASRPRKRENPAYDHIAAGLARLAMQVDPTSEDALLAWVDEHGRWIDDDDQRDRARGMVALAMVEAFSPRAYTDRAAAVRDALTAWIAELTQARRDDVRRAARRLYRHQHDAPNADLEPDAARDWLGRPQGPWFAIRGIVEAVNVIQPGKTGANSLAASLGWWDADDRTSFYAALEQKGSIRDSLVFVGDYAVSAGVSAAGGAFKLANATQGEMERMWAGGSTAPITGVHHALIAHLIGVWTQHQQRFQPGVGPRSEPSALSWHERA